MHLLSRHALMKQANINRIAFLGNKFCKIFSHYEFLVQLVFAPRFKQRHIPRYKNDNNRKTHVESTRAMTRERGARAESKNCEILLFPTADRRFDTKVKCPTGRASFWVKFPTVRSLTRVKCPGIAPGGRGMGGFRIDWYIIEPWVSCEFGVGPSIWTLLLAATYATEADYPDFKGCCMIASSFSFFVRSQTSYPPNYQYPLPECKICEVHENLLCRRVEGYNLHGWC